MVVQTLYNFEVTFVMTANHSTVAHIQNAYDKIAPDSEILAYCIRRRRLSLGIDKQVYLNIWRISYSSYS